MAFMCQNARQWLKNKTVVAADDDLPSLELLQFILLRHGASVLEALDGIEALEITRTVHPDLVIADLSMPEMNGWDLIREIRRDRIVAHTPVVALTAHAMVGIREQALKTGFDAYFSKPYHPIELVRSLAEVLRQSTPRGTIASSDTSRPITISG